MTVVESLEVLARRLREAGLAPDAEELADALWLARHIPGTATTARTPDESPAPPPASVPPAEPRPSGAVPEAQLAVPSAPARRQPADPPTVAATGVAAEGGAEATGEVVATRVPAASVLPEPIALQRALRPLNRYRPPGRPVWSGTDEEATAERAADTGVVVPLPLRRPRREARLQLVMDVSSSTVVWRDTLQELRQVCERAGAFREIQVHYLHEGREGVVRASSSPDPAAPTRGPGVLRDPSGHQLTLVLSDCAGPLWRGGRIQRLLYDWTSCAPLAVVQPLPQRMWRGTHLPAFSGELLRHEGPAGGLEFRSARAEAPSGRALPVPVLALRPASLTNWVRLVSDATAQRLVTSAAWVRADHPAATAPPRAEREISSRDRVRSFRRNASRDARRLAEYLATVPLVLPVMQLVQRAMLPDSGPEAMAEVLLGGLMRSSDKVAEGGYEFIDKVRDELLRHLPGGEARLVLKHSSQYVERQYGRSARNFPALAAAYLSGATGARPVVEDAADDRLLRAFARVSAQVLARYGKVPSAPPGTRPGELTSRARELLDRYLAQGTARDLDEGIALLRQALEVERREAGLRDLRSRLARALLERWQVAGAAENLREAYEVLPRQRAIDAEELLTGAHILIHIAVDLEAAGAAAETRPAGLGRDLGEPEAPARRLALLAYKEAEQRLSRMPLAAPESLATQGIGLRATAVLRSASLVARAGGEVLGPDDEPPQEWAARQFERAVELATQHWMREGSTRTQLFQGRALLALARHNAGRGDIRWAPDVQRRELSYRSAELAEIALREALPPRAAEGAEPHELAQICLDVASALDLTRHAARDPRIRRRIVDVLNEGLEYAADDQEQRSVCFDRLGETYLTTHELTREPSDLESAIWSWWQSAGCLPLDDAARPRLLHRLGLALQKAGEWSDAVRVLRMAVDEVPEHDPELSRYRVEFGEALLRRNLSEGGLSDLHEADWILGTAARETDDDGLAARAWTVRGTVARHLALRTGQPSEWNAMADHLVRAIELLTERGDTIGAASARAARAEALLHMALATRAAEEYRTALRLYEEAGLGDSEEATAVRAALRGDTPSQGDA